MRGSLCDRSIISCLAAWSHDPSRMSLSLVPCSFQGGLCPSHLSLGDLCPGDLCPGDLCPGGLCPGGLCPAGLCLGESMSKGVSAWGVSDQEGICLVGSLFNGSLSWKSPLTETPWYSKKCVIRILLERIFVDLKCFHLHLQTATAQVTRLSVQKDRFV